MTGTGYAGYPAVGTSATIYLQGNSSSAGYWKDFSTVELALTLIHELGHVYNYVIGLGGSQIVYDANRDGSPNKDAEEKNAKLLKACTPH